jgi:hypothetical protein
MPNKDPKFICGYIDWVLQTQSGVQRMHNTRYYVAQYIQSIEDTKIWIPLWEKYIKQTPKNGVILPTNEEELTCLFVHTYERVYKEKYKPVNSFQRDTAKIKQLKGYLGHNFQSTIDFILWALEKVMPAQKEKPNGPPDLYRFISDFKEIKKEVIVDDLEYRRIVKVHDIMQKLERKAFDITDPEKTVLTALFEHIRFDQLNIETKNRINQSELFSIIDNKIFIK